jgi:hypothetical protein
MVLTVRFVGFFVVGARLPRCMPGNIHAAPSPNHLILLLLHIAPLIKMNALLLTTA